MFGGSLNEGCELDDEDTLQDEAFFKGPVVPGEVPELRDDKDFIGLLQGRAQDIDYLKTDITRNKGMSKTYALEAMRICPEFGEPAIGRFTTIASPTLYQASLESLTEGIKAIFKKILEKIQELIKRIISFFSGDDPDKPISDSQYEKSKNSLNTKADETRRDQEVVQRHFEESCETNQELLKYKDFLQQVVPQTQGNPYAELVKEVLEKRPGQAISAILEQRDPFVYDLVYQGPYIRAIKAISDNFAMVANSLHFKIEILKQLYVKKSTISNDSFKTQDQIRQLSLVGVPLTLMVNRKEMTVDQALQYLENTRYEVKDRRFSEPISFDDLSNRMLTNDKSVDFKVISQSFYPVLDKLIDMEKILGELKSSFSLLNFGESQQPGNEQFNEVARKTFLTLASELNSLSLMVRTVKHTVDLIVYLKVEITHFADNLLEFASKEANKADIRVPTALVNRQKQILTYRRTLFQAHRRLTLGTLY